MKKLILATIAMLALGSTAVYAEEQEQQEIFGLGIAAALEFESLDIDSSGNVSYGAGTNSRTDSHAANMWNARIEGTRQTKLGDLVIGGRFTISGDSDFSSQTNCSGTCDGVTQSGDASRVEAYGKFLFDVGRYMPMDVVDATFKVGPSVRMGTVDLPGGVFRDTTVSDQEMDYVDFGGEAIYSFAVNAENQLSLSGDLMYSSRESSQAEKFSNGSFTVDNTYGYDCSGVSSTLQGRWDSDLSNFVDGLSVFTYAAVKFDVSSSCDTKVSSSLSDNAKTENSDGSMSNYMVGLGVKQTF